MEEVEKQLRKQAQILGNLNLQLNKFVEQNQQVSQEIIKLQQRIAKKKKVIEQESKDKAIIQQKLIQDQERKNKLQIQAGDHQHKEQVEETKVVQQDIKRPQFLDKPIKKQEPKIVPKQQKKEKKQLQEQSNYNSSDKGQYQPPLLLMPQNDGSGQQNSENEQQDEKVLEEVRKKLQNLGKAEDEEDD